VDKRLIKFIALTVFSVFVLSTVGCGGSAKRRITVGHRSQGQSRSGFVVRGQSHKEPSKHAKEMFIWPLEGGIFMSPFGMRRGRRHDGIDVAAKGGTPIKASADGKVVFSGRMRGYGNLVLLKHENNYFTAYAHNSRNVAGKGKEVKQGQVVALVGRTGRATGNHVHFEVRRGQQAMNPLNFLPARAGVLVKKGTRIQDAIVAVKTPKNEETSKKGGAKSKGEIAMGGGSNKDKKELVREVTRDWRDDDLEGIDELVELHEGDEVAPKDLVLTRSGKAMRRK